jgi:hypothetical protein
MVRPVREILGDNVVPLRISEPPKSHVSRPADVSAPTQVKPCSIKLCLQISILVSASFVHF